MTHELLITCPKCKSDIKLTESLAAPLIESTRRHYEQKISEKDAAFAKREAAVQAQLVEVAKARAAINEQVAQKVETERRGIAAEESEKARLLFAHDLEAKIKELISLREIVRQQDQKLTEAQKVQADLIRQQRELEDAKRELEVIIERRVQESLTAVRDKAKLEAEDAFRLKILEKEQTIEGMKQRIDDLKRRAEQGSQQLQGEVQELALEAILRTRFPQDSIEPVPKGEHGGDVLQIVFSPFRQACGSILWESKRTKSWSDGWLSKLREDQRSAKADFAIIVSQALPKEVDAFDLIDGVWVTSTRCAAPVAIALRHSLIELAGIRQACEGQQTKMEMIYQYLTGPRFRHRIQAIVEKFSDMREDLEKERKAMTRLWTKREEQIRCVLEATAGMYGDLQGIAGKTLLEIEGLELAMLADAAGVALPAALS